MSRCWGLFGFGLNERSAAHARARTREAYATRVGLNVSNERQAYATTLTH